MHHFRLSGKAVIASLLAGLVLLLDAMAVCPDLHELVHHDAQTAQHQCAVTLFAHGQVDAASVDVACVASFETVFVCPSVRITVYAPAIENLPAGRAPPVIVSSLA